MTGGAYGMSAAPLVLLTMGGIRTGLRHPWQTASVSARASGTFNDSRQCGHSN